MIILCDFNLHLAIPSHHTETFTDILTSFGLLQHVNFTTHIHGHWLDLCITRSASQIVSSIFPSDGLSDHLTVIAEQQSDLHRHTAKKQITYRRINLIGINAFKTDISKSQLITNPNLSKKPSLSKDDMKNYRQVSNLNFISQMIKKIISNRIRSHLDKNNLSNPNQSAYNPIPSTETALLKIHNDICMNMDSDKTTALVLLDLSAAFDTLDHSSIIELLSGW